MGTNKKKEKGITYLPSDRTRSFKEGIPLEHSIGQSPYKYYEKSYELGLGSMGAVMKVDKKPGFARPKVNEPKKTGYLPSFSVFSKTSTSAKTKKFESKKQTAFAMKRILLDKVCPEYIDELRNEISILRYLDHPNIVRLYEIYDVKSQIYVVMELCSGGDLWERMPYSEESACTIVRKLVSAVALMHEGGISHRDIKMENILFENETPSAEIKVIDFGLSKKFIPGEQMINRVGSFYTMAPQVLNGVYTSQADMWGVGVIAYILLSGEKPFEASSDEEMIEKIIQCDYHFNGSAWSSISRDAKDFITQLIEIDPEKRLTAKQANQSKWLQKKDQCKVLDKEFVDRLHKTISHQSESSLMKKIGLLIIAHNSFPEEIIQLRGAFEDYDYNNDGIITFDDFQKATERFGLEEIEMKLYFEKLDVYGNHLVYYTEFLAATLEILGNIEEDRLADAFNRIDIDHTGYISKDNIKQILGIDYDSDLVEQAIKELDHDGKGKISFEEFKMSFTHQSSQVYDVQYNRNGKECILDEKAQAPRSNDNKRREYIEQQIELRLR